MENKAGLQFIQIQFISTPTIPHCCLHIKYYKKLQNLIPKNIIKPNTIKMASPNPPFPAHLSQFLLQLGLDPNPPLPQLELGLLFSKILHEMNPNQPSLALSASSSALNRVNNWNAIIEEMKKYNIRINQQEKSKIVNCTNGYVEILYQILGKIVDYYGKNQKDIQVDISKIDGKGDMEQASSLLQLFIIGIMRFFGLNAKQSVALLSNQCKYLAHILVKGLKSQFKPIQLFLSQLHKNLPLIAIFCSKNRENELFFLRAIKPALISKSSLSSQLSLSILQKFLLSPTLSLTKQRKLETISTQFINTLILNLRRHGNYDLMAGFLLRVLGYEKEMITVLERGQASEGEIFGVLTAIVKNVIGEGQGQEGLERMMGIKGFQEFLTKGVQNLRRSQNAIAAMDLLILISETSTDFLSNPERGSRFIQNIQQVKISKRSDLITFINQLFTLLSIFAKDRNQLAPAIFKILISMYKSTLSPEISAIFSQNFSQLLADFPSIPYPLILEVMTHRLEHNTLQLSTPELQFFQSVMACQGLELRDALIIFNFTSKSVVEGEYGSLGVGILVGVLRKFGNQGIVGELVVKMVKVCLAMHFANVKRLGNKRKSVTGNAKMDPQDVICKSKNLALQDFIYKISQEGVQDINKSTEPLICYSLLQVEHLSKQNAAGLRRIISLFGDPAQIIKKYQVQAKKLQQQQQRKQQKKGNSKIKQAAWGGASKIRYNQAIGQPQTKQRSSSHVSSDQVLKNTKVKAKLDPMLLSHSGVHPAAMKGLQKYQKSYLLKVQKAQQQQQKKKQLQDRQHELKRIFQRKMLQKGIQVKKVSQQQFKYIFEFNQKQKQLQSDTVHTTNLPLFSPQLEQQRDVRGLEYCIRKYQRILKLYYNIYSGHSKPQNLSSFDQIAQKIGLLYSNSLWKMLKDHGFDEFLTVKEMQYLAKKVNHLQGKEYEDSTALDYEAFEGFIVQASYGMWTRPPKDLRGRPIFEMIQETISRFRLYASQNKINQKLFDDPDNVFYNQTEAVKQLNKKLEDNPDYILPQGYKKITEKKVIYTHRIFLDAMSPSYKDVYQIINEIIHSTIGVHIIEPFTTYQTVAKARPNLYFKQRQQGEVQSERLSNFIKKQVAKMPIKDRETGKQVAGVLDQIIEAVQFGHDRIGMKLQNKVIKQKKMQQEQQAKKQQQEKRKWAQRNRQIKSALVKHKQSAQQKKKQQEQKKQEQKRKQQQEKRKRQQQQQRLKKKVEGYQKKKQQDEQRRKKQQAQRKKKQKQQAQRKKRQAEQTKKKIQESKLKKQEEEKQKKQEQQAAQKARKQKQKKKFEEDQKRKKEMVEEYKNKKSSDINQSQISSPNQNRSQVKVLDSGLKNLERKKLV